MKNSTAFYLLLFTWPILIQMACKPIRPKENVPVRVLKNWQFKVAEAPDSSYLEAVVPGSVFSDLQRHELIPDPFYWENEQKVQWVGWKDWDYLCSFDDFDDQASNRTKCLEFDGLDTHADVYLNDSLILSAANMFTTYRIPVTGLLKPFENKLLIRFKSPLRYDSLQQAAHPFLYPDPRSFTRKAPYQYGWDWGPRLVGMGIWNPVRLISYDNFYLDHAAIVTESISAGTARLSLIAKVEAESQQPLHVTGKLEKSKYLLIDTLISPESGRVKLSFAINAPKLWWPNGLGNPHLYNFHLTISDRQTAIDTSLRFGLSDIDLVQEKDSIGQSFYFVVNGQKVFVKGANYIPEHSFPSQATQEKTRQLLTDAAAVGMNMIRVWGGGIYPDEQFYDLCDSLGLMVWQDFMFACNFYPADIAFLENIQTEVSQQVQRIYHRPSLALWCGNNEIDEAWHNWGYQEALNYSVQDQQNIWNDYQILFDRLIPKTIRGYDRHTPYIPTSPKIGWGHEEALHEGDMHYWGVWWGAQPFEIYKEKTGRFMSEYGFQSFPDISVIKKYMIKDSFDLKNPGLLNHQKHPRGHELIREYMARDFEVPDEFEEFVYVSQLVQQRGMEIAIEAHRKNKGRCMGTLYWQLNDCWPAISWSSLDYELNWKAFHYSLRRLYKAQILVVEKLERKILVYLVNDDPEIKKGKIQANLKDFSGNLLWEQTEMVDIDYENSSQVLEIDLKQLPANIDAKMVVFTFHFSNNGNELASSLFYMEKPKNLALTRPVIEVQAKPTSVNKLGLVLSSNTLVKNLYLFHNSSGHFSDNYFDLIPGEEKTISFDGPFISATEFVEGLDFLSLNEGGSIILKAD